MLNNQILFILLFLVLLFGTAACSPGDLVGEPVAAVNAEVFIFSGGVEKRLISDEKIVQDNCNGSAEMSQTVTRQHMVQYTLELGAGLTVSAEGKVGLEGIGLVGVGAEVATHYKVSYGRQETASRSQTVAAAPNSHIQHIIQQFEVWETGEVLIVAGDQNQRLPYSFRRDFSIEAVAPANLGCTTSATTPRPLESATSSIATSVSVLPTSGITDCNGNTVRNTWAGIDGAISHFYGFPVGDTGWGATANPSQSIGEVALVFGPYIDLAPGQYRVIYRIKISGNESPNTLVARLNVGAHVNGINNPDIAKGVFQMS